MQGKSYHRYFEGFSERKVWDENKKKYRLERFYSGDYYEAQLPDTERKRIKKEYLLGYICGILIFLIATTRAVQSNASIITAIPTLLILVCLLWQIPSLTGYLSAKQRLMAREYRERRNFMSMNMGLACAMGIGAVSHLLYIFRYGCFTDMLEWLVLGAHVLDALLFARIYTQEKRIVYIRIENENSIPADCYDITFQEQ